jgi:hypothetical protein
MEVPRQYPLVLLVRAGLVKIKGFGSVEGRRMKTEARTEVELGLTAFHRDFEFWRSCSKYLKI